MSPMQRALGSDWSRLPAALQAHHRDGVCIDRGHLDIEYPRGMQPVLNVMKLLGALVHRRGTRVTTTVVKQTVVERQHWRRTFEYDDGRVLRFDSVLVAREGHLIEFVNPMLGLEMVPGVVNGRRQYRDIRYAAKLGVLVLPIPEWLVLGHTTIVEQAVGDRHFAMDFRATHPLLGQLFRYSGRFEADVRPRPAGPAGPAAS